VRAASRREKDGQVDEKADAQAGAPTEALAEERAETMVIAP
jgi:hypothetical protein